MERQVLCFRAAGPIIATLQKLAAKRKMSVSDYLRLITDEHISNSKGGRTNGRKVAR